MKHQLQRPTPIGYVMIVPACATARALERSTLRGDMLGLKQFPAGVWNDCVYPPDPGFYWTVELAFRTWAKILRKHCRKEPQWSALGLLPETLQELREAVSKVRFLVGEDNPVWLDLMTPEERRSLEPVFATIEQQVLANLRAEVQRALACPFVLRFTEWFNKHRADSMLLLLPSFGVCYIEPLETRGEIKTVLFRQGRVNDRVAAVRRELAKYLPLQARTDKGFFLPRTDDRKEEAGKAFTDYRFYTAENWGFESAQQGASWNPSKVCDFK